MDHLAPGLLRRAIDEPQALLSSQRRHLDACGACERKSQDFAARARAVAAALGATSPALRSSTARTGYAPPASRLPTIFWSACAAAAIVLLAAAIPLRTLAENFLAVFEPRQFVALPISGADERLLRTLPNLDRYGTMRNLTPERHASVADAQHAALLAGIPVRVLTIVPAGAGTPHYEVLSRRTSAFTFSAAKAEAAAASAGQRLPAMPPRLDGSTLEASVGPAVIAAYGSPQQPSLVKRRHGFAHAWPRLMVAQMPMPLIASNGVPAITIVNYLTSQPGVPPQLVAELRAIADPTTTLPIPIPIDRMHAATVTVREARGLAVGDNTGIGAGVIWQSRGFVYWVGGEYPLDTILSIANSLH